MSYQTSSDLYLLMDLDVNLVPLSVAANQRREFMKILHCDWLPPKVGQEWRRGRFQDIVFMYYKKQDVEGQAFAYTLEIYRKISILQPVQYCTNTVCTNFSSLNDTSTWYFSVAGDVNRFSFASLSTK